MGNNVIRELEYDVRYLGEAPQDKENVVVVRSWKEDICHTTVTNNGANNVAIKEVVLFKGKWNAVHKNKIYGEGYSMLSQYGGTVHKTENITPFSDHIHYKLPKKEGFNTVYNVLVLEKECGVYSLMGFTSCNKFQGEIRFNDDLLEIVMDTENLVLASGATWDLEMFMVIESKTKNALLEEFARQIQHNHPMLKVNEIPTGWCSWYWYGPDVTEKDIFDNLKASKSRAVNFKYIQIDDGYQADMGDWFVPGEGFTSNMKMLCQKIRQEGFEPAVWVAPFIAGKNSKVFLEHPEWFVKDEEGMPLASDQVSFGGWRLAPWYMLDGTHPEVLKHLKNIFSTMKEEWGCTYFKLDANMWGAMPFGKRYDSSLTRVEAYRKGMQAIIEGAGKDSFILGCNAPMWPSLGLVHGMRVSGDIARDWGTIKNIARETFYRNWQNNNLWLNDPDCIVLQNQQTTAVAPEEFMFHAAYIYASGGMRLAGDDMVTLETCNKAILQKLLRPMGKTACFDDENLTVGRMVVEEVPTICLFNWDDQVLSVAVKCEGCKTIKNFWTGELYELPEQGIVRRTLKPHSAELWECY